LRWLIIDGLGSIQAEPIYEFVGLAIRRYWSGLVRMRLDYLALADLAAIYDNLDGIRVLIAQRRPESGFVVHDPARWAIIEGAKPWNT
jgi:hypothetical protein